MILFCFLHVLFLRRLYVSFDFPLQLTGLLICYGATSNALWQYSGSLYGIICIQLNVCVCLCFCLRSGDTDEENENAEKDGKVEAGQGKTYLSHLIVWQVYQTS